MCIYTKKFCNELIASSVIKGLPDNPQVSVDVLHWQAEHVDVEEANGDHEKPEVQRRRHSREEPVGEKDKGALVCEDDLNEIGEVSRR